MLLNNALEIIDLSTQARLGIKGPNAITWLSQQGIEVPSMPNQWLILNNQYLLLRLGMNDFLIQATNRNDQNKQQDFIQKIENSLTTVMRECAGVYLVPRADASLMLKGNGVTKLLSQICRLNTELTLQGNAVVMTHIAGIPAILIKEAHSPTVYRMWFDLSYLAYITSTVISLADTNLDFELV